MIWNFLLIFDWQIMWFVEISNDQLSITVFGHTIEQSRVLLSTTAWEFIALIRPNKAINSIACCLKFRNSV